MAATKTTTPHAAELALAQQILAAATKGDLRTAIARAEQGARKFPTFQIPAGEGQPSPTFAQAAEHLRGLAGESKGGASEAPAAPAEESAPARKPAARKTAPKAEPKPEPVKVQVTTLRLVHDGTNPTSLYGVEKGSPAHLAIGAKRNGGRGWHFWAQGPCFYLPRSGGYAPQTEEIAAALSAIDALEQDGQKLYRVETDVRTTGADGKALPVRMTKAQAAEWQRRYDGARNSLNWALGMGNGQCGTCGTTGLTLHTGRIGKADDGMPVAECATCGGFAVKAEPKPEPKAEPKTVVRSLTMADIPQFAGLLALSATPEPTPQSVECPSCKAADVAVIDGNIALHSKPIIGGACRGRVVTDVEPEPAVKAARKVRPVSAAPAQTAAPVAEPVDADGMVVRFALQAGLSGSARNQTATDVRSALSRKLTYGKAFRGVKTETRRDKVNHRLIITITEGGEGFDAEELAEAIAAIVKGVRGVGNRVHKG